MKAEEAKRIYMENILNKILEASRNGINEITIEEIPVEYLYELKELGYKIELSYYLKSKWCYFGLYNAKFINTCTITW